MKEVPLTTILTQLEDRECTQFVLLLGAGASRSSGIPVKAELCDDLKKRIFLSETGKTQDQLPDVNVEEASNWCARQAWYMQNEGRDEYGLLLMYFYLTKARVRKYLESWMDGKDPSDGLRNLAVAIKNNVFNAVLTTNFDHLVEDALYAVGIKHPYVVDQEKKIDMVQLTDKKPKVIKLHGDFLYNPLNLESEIVLEANMKEKLEHLLTERALIVVGYGGNDKSVMGILKSIAGKPSGFLFGLYWLHRAEDALSPYVQDLQSPNCFSCEIPSSDWFFQKVTSHLKLKDEALTPKTFIEVPVVAFDQGVGNKQWQAQLLPSNAGNVILNGSDVTDIAVGAGTIYAIDVKTATGNVYRSNDGGASWSKTTAPAAVALTKISIAPDNDNVIAVTDGASVYISNNAGSTWSELPSLATTIWAGVTITDLSITPARSDTLLGREYVVAVADPMPDVTLRGDVLIIGGTTVWTTVGPVDFNGTRDYMAVAVSPNFVSDRSVVALGAAAKAGSSGASGVVAQVINTATHKVVSTAHLGTGYTTDFGAASKNPTSIVRGSIALPSDFDANTSLGRRAFVGFASAAEGTKADNDVYRIDDSKATALGAVTARGICSVAYSGTANVGTLFEAPIDTAPAEYSTEMTSRSPTWMTAKKLMPGTTTNNIIKVSPDFATSNKVYLATSGAGSAFSVSTDGGISFNQKSLIDIAAGAANNIGQLTSGPIIAPDGKTAFVATVASGNVNLWVSPMPSRSDSWMQILVVRGGLASNGGLVIMCPDYAQTSTFYLMDLSASGNIYRTTDAGATWSNRLHPIGFLINRAVFQDANTGWVTDLAGNIYKTTNGCWTWTVPVNANVGNVRSLITGEAGELIIGGTGKVAISKDGGATFTTYDGYAGESYLVTRDTEYANNNILWLADASGVTGATYRLCVGKDAKPVNLLAPSAGTPVITMAIRSGVLYSFHSNRFDRTVNPLGTPGQISWQSIPLITHRTADVSVVRDSNSACNILYVSSGAVGSPELWAYRDYLIDKAKAA